MIFVTIGTSEPFDRLIRAVEALDFQEEVIVQTGRSEIRPRTALCVDFLPFDELVAYVRGARLVITHAGAGTVLTVLAQGKRPVVVPRLARFGEAVDDHQLAFARRLAANGLAVLAEEESGLEDAVCMAKGLTAAIALQHESRLMNELRVCLTEWIGPPKPGLPARAHGGGARPMVA